ncbi:hypothetical protein LOD99_3523 [Oopsacas minuta]|uniref:Uncharacterized protein n=1 Tax=Oopsacas minuta TaxID=111878 RepID=A0AAV7JX78_9METZ|nr:hypothetical protein LOD99_3523 [Oopsacas minuta]
MYHKSSATVTRNGIEPIDNSVTMKTNSILSPNRIQTNRTTRLTSKQHRSTLEEHLSDLKNKERSFFPPSLPTFSTSEAPIKSPSLLTNHSLQYQIYPDFVNQKLAEQVGSDNTIVNEYKPSPEHVIIQQSKPLLNSTDYTIAEYSDYGDSIIPATNPSNQLPKLFLSPLEPCHTASYMDTDFPIFNNETCIETNEHTLTLPPDSIPCKANKLDIYSNEI